jgi:hypothetical protein
VVQAVHRPVLDLHDQLPLVVGVVIPVLCAAARNVLPDPLT